ncbi:unnamed protein product [Amoebophrya sp. A25]|nr:unnamed protein product [Amoebophrya sp. A25]|eukprot:GSA25T00011496001.1
MDFLLGAVSRVAHAREAREQAPPAQIRAVDALACQLCGISYKPKGEREPWLEGLGLTLCVEKVAWFIAVRDGEGFVVFRGTASARDVFTDLAAHPSEAIPTYAHHDGFSRPYLPATQFHSGMYKNVIENVKLRSALEQVGLIHRRAPICEREIAQFPWPAASHATGHGSTRPMPEPTRWYFVGHSLGGGSAQMCMTLLQKGYFESERFIPTKLVNVPNDSPRTRPGDAAGSVQTRGQSNHEMNGASTTSSDRNDACSNSNADPSASDRDHLLISGRQEKTGTGVAAKITEQIGEASDATYQKAVEEEFRPMHRLTHARALEDIVVEAIVFASPPIFFDPQHDFKQGDSNKSGEELQHEQEKMVGSWPSGQGGSKKRWTAHSGHKITAFVFHNDPIPRLDRQEDNVLLRLLEKTGRVNTATALKSVNHYIHHSNQKTIWMLPDALLSHLETVQDVGAFVAGAAKNIYKKVNKALEKGPSEKGNTITSSNSAEEIDVHVGVQASEKSKEPPPSGGGGFGFMSFVAAAAKEVANKLEETKSDAAKTKSDSKDASTRSSMNYYNNNSEQAEDEIKNVDHLERMSASSSSSESLAVTGTKKEKRPPLQTKAVQLSSVPTEAFSRQRMLHVNDSNPADHSLYRYEFGIKDYFQLREIMHNTPLYERKLDNCVDT